MKAIPRPQHLKTAIIASCVLIIALSLVGSAFYWFYVLPAAQRFTPIKATQFYGLAISWWKTDYEKGKNNLPGAYPMSFDDLAIHGYLEKEFMTILNKDLIVEFHPPPQDVKDQFVMVSASSPTTTWVVRLHDNQDGKSLYPSHEPLKNTAEQGAAANP